MRYILTLILLLISVTANALTMRDDAPTRYVVQPGDSLWEVAGRFLKYPWEWKELWHANPKIKNPNRIYPGMAIELKRYHNKPFLKVLANGTIKMSPGLRSKPLTDAIPPIPLDDIKPFLDPSLILDHDVLENAPYIVAFTNEHLLAGQGDEVYVNGVCANPCTPVGKNVSYSVFRPDGEYMDPKTKRILGYKSVLVAYAELISPTEPAKMVLTDIRKGVRLKDRVLPSPRSYFDISFEPKAPSMQVCGGVVDLMDDYTQGAAGLVSVIDLGKDVGVEPGDVLAVYSPEKVIRNPEFPPRFVKLPPERIGEVMVFRTFTHTSFALVMRSIRSIRKGDVVKNP